MRISNVKFTIFILLLCCAFFGTFTAKLAFAQSTKIGFVKDSIWYSKDPFFEGDKIKIYTLLWNPENQEFIGAVNFFDDTILLGKKDFKIAPTTAQIISIEWVVTAGSHKIFAKIDNPKLVTGKSTFEEVYVKIDETDKSSRTATREVSLPDLPSIKETLKESIGDGGYANTIKNFGENTLEKVPDFIAEPISRWLGGVDNFRANIAEVSKNQEEKVTEQIGMIKIAKMPSQEPTESKNTRILKPLKYLELFFLALFSMIFENKIFFYVVSILLILLILKYIWGRVF